MNNKNKKKPINLIYGCRGSGLKCLEIIIHKQIDIDLHGFIDDDPSLVGKFFFGYKVFDKKIIKDLVKKNIINLYLSVGDPLQRNLIHKSLPNKNINYPNLVHPNANISCLSNMGQGNIICQNSIIQPGCKLGNFNILNLDVKIGPLVKIGNFNTINANSFIGSEAKILNFNYFGMSLNILPRIKVGSSNNIGAVSLINKNIQNHLKAFGIPLNKKNKNK